VPLTSPLAEALAGWHRLDQMVKLFQVAELMGYKYVLTTRHDEGVSVGSAGERAAEVEHGRHTDRATDEHEG